MNLLLCIFDIDMGFIMGHNHKCTLPSAFPFEINGIYHSPTHRFRRIAKHAKLKCIPWKAAQLIRNSNLKAISYNQWYWFPNKMYWGSLSKWLFVHTIYLIIFPPKIIWKASCKKAIACKTGNVHSHFSHIYSNHKVILFIYLLMIRHSVFKSLHESHAHNY